jgi:hypothetical protein
LKVADELGRQGIEGLDGAGPGGSCRPNVPNGQPRITLRIRVADRTLSADVNAKSLRRCIAAIGAAEPGGVAVVLQGTLNAETRSDGLRSQQRTLTGIQRTVSRLLIVVQQRWQDAMPSVRTPWRTSSDSCARTGSTN